MENSKKTKTIGDILQALTIAILFLVILLLVVFAAKSYQSAANGQRQNESLRAVGAYVAASVRGHAGGEVKTEDFAGYPGVSIESGDTGYAHRIYLKDGELLEEYTKADIPANPQTASKIGETSVFAVSYISEDLLEIRTDQGVSYVHVE